MSGLEGQVLKGRYRIDELIGRGGMAEVYRAWDGQRNYHVAVKVMREDLAEDAEFLARFRQEAQALAALSHANIVRFYSFEREGRLAFIVMDHVQGTTLRGVLLDAGGQPLPLGLVGHVLAQVCGALHYAHGENLLHRDIKPGNLMIEPSGRVLVADFGIAKAADSATATTVMPGTPAYMSPEQCRSEMLDARTDVYSLGIVSYEMLAGRRPFSGESAEIGTGSTREKIRWEQIHALPRPLQPSNPAVTPKLEAAVLKALAKERAERWPTMLAFWQALDGALQAAGVGADQRSALPPEVAPPSPPAPGPATGGMAQRVRLGWILTAAAALIAVVALLFLALPRRGPVPNLIGLPLGQAAAALEAAGFRLDAPGEANKDRERWMVVAQNPAAGERRAAGSDIEVYVTPQATARPTATVIPDEPTAPRPTPTSPQPSPTATERRPTATRPRPTATRPRPTATQPRPTATPSRAPEATAMSTADIVCNFDDAPCRWGWDYSSAGAQANFTDGQLLIEVWQPDTVRQYMLAGQTFSDFTVEVDLMQVGGHPGAGYGLVFRHRDDENCYRFTLTGQGEFEFGREIKNKWSYFAGYQGAIQSSSIRPAGQRNHLKITCAGSQITAYVNGKQVAKATDSTLRSGSVGLLVGTEATGQRVQVYFDNFTVDYR